MKYFFSLCIIFSSLTARPQKTENIIIITTDGFRWQEIFRGMDSSIANNPKFNQGDSTYLFKKYWSDNIDERRKKLMPFLWGTMALHGQFYGNRDHHNKVDNANPYWFSYPGYNEIFTGYPDTAINSNEYPPNPHSNVLGFLNKQQGYENKVAAFGAWDAFDRILNEQKSGIPVYSAFDKTGGKQPTSTEKTINALLEDSYKPFREEECLDVFTHYAAMNYLQTKKPRVLYISYGETDEWAHRGQYRDYLDAAAMVDKWIGMIWEFVQNDPQYKNKTAIFITTDHGRGDVVKEEWTSHYNKIIGSNQIWFAAMGPQIKPKGEIKETRQLYQKQFAQTFASLLGLYFKCEHEVADKIELN